MRIGIDARLWSQTGVGRYTRNLVFNLQIVDKVNSYVLFVRAEDFSDVNSKIQNSKFKIQNCDIRWHTVKEQILFPEILKRENLDLVHFPYFSVPVFYTKPFVVTIHDLILNHFPTGKASTLAFPLYQFKLLGYRFVISQAAKKAKKIIAVSKTTKEEIADHLEISENKIAVIYEGIDDALSAKLKTPACQSLALTDRQKSKLQLKTKNFFLYVGNAYPHKNLERLIRAFKILISEYPNISLILVGKEDYFYKRLRNRVKKMNVQNSVTFAGEVADKELFSLYKNAKALIIPSLMEGFSLPSLEAMSAGCLVLASDIPALREVCQGAAIFFNPYDIEDMKNKMQIICFNDLNHFSSKIQKGIERAKMFSWRKMAEETVKVYRNAVESP